MREEASSRIKQLEEELSKARLVALVITCVS